MEFNRAVGEVRTIILELRIDARGSRSPFENSLSGGKNVLKVKGTTGLGAR
jgi:hypothetical protein